jgi:hypothetical protein
MNIISVKSLLEPSEENGKATPFRPKNPFQGEHRQERLSRNHNGQITPRLILLQRV